MSTRFPNRDTAAGRVVTGGILAVLALALSYIEFLLPGVSALPGVKLGLANLVVLFALYAFDLKTAALVNLARIALAALLFSGFFGMLYSLAGAVLSLAVMYGLKRTGRFSVVAVSVAGGCAHNLGQLFVASLLVETKALLAYYPILFFSGAVSGFVTGAVAYALLKRLAGAGFARNEI